MDLLKFNGTGVALVTPFDQHGAIDYDGLHNLLKYTADHGVDYWVVQGTTGESPTITAIEKKAILQFIIAHNPNKLPIVYGIGGNNTAQVLDTIGDTNFNGIDAILSASPYYNKPTQAGLIKHYEVIADASPVPVILYNVPGRTASNIEAITTLTLANHDNIIGIKEASGNIEQAMRIARSKTENFFLTSGDDTLTVSLMAIGAVGVISVLANGFPSEFSQMVNSCLDNDYQTASNLAFSMIDINTLMYEESNPVGIKEVLSQLSICANHTRMPLLPASNDLAEKIEQALELLN
jgi:4-hydroxy-tetrahydrodipicolinate synthase